MKVAVSEVVPVTSAPATGTPSPGTPPRAAPSTPSTPHSGAGWLALGAVTSKTAQTAVLLVFASVLDPAAFGVVSLGAVLLNVTTVVADLGTSTALVHHRGDAERAARTALSLALAVSVGLVATVWAAAPWLARQLQGGDLATDVLRGIVLCVPLAAVAGVSGELLRRALDFRRRVIPDIVGNGIGAAVTVAALAAGEGAFSLVYGQLVQAFVVVLMFWLVRRPVRPGWSGEDASTLLSYGAGLAGANLLVLVTLNVDYVLIANQLGVHDVGLYSMAFRVAYMPYLLIAMVLGGAVFAHLCRLRGSAVGRAAIEAAVTLHTLVVPVYVAIILFAPQLTLLGEVWAPAVPALRWLAGYGLLLSALELLLVLLKSVGRTVDVLGLTAFHFVLLVGLLLAVVDRGVTAVAIAQFVAGLITLVAAVSVVRRRVPEIPWNILTDRLRRLLLVAGGLAVVAAGGVLAVEQPVLVLGLTATLVVTAVAVTRVEWVALAYVAVEPWADQVRGLHPAAVKVVGGLLFVSWLLRLVQRGRPADVRHHGVLAAVALLAVMMGSLVVNGADLAVGADHATSYLSYVLVLVVLVDTIRQAQPSPAHFARRLLLVFAASCTAAGAVALVGFLATGGRAGGPLEDPNDLAFHLVAALPFLLLLRRSAVSLMLALAAGSVLVVATAATLSRGAALGLAVAVLVTLLLRAVRLSTTLTIGVLVATVLGALWLTHADVVDRSVQEKQHIAATNVDLRATTASMAASMTAESPLLGQGPGGFAETSSRFVPAGVPAVDQTVAHQMYLDVSAELGLLGLGAFLLVIGAGVRGALRARAVPESRPVAITVLVSSAAVLVAACFLSEQFYLPVWLLAAAGIALDPAPVPSRERT
ncbi:O-antigen ligase family protein [Nocardioides stalactiti]|uniref:O-antigen ligase family protein n=1 Tax=Nocardioides stalactiti TaxID=2755356 RepID=UPI0016035467|nr:O-antigen ligase family protein [Nocardioides stalactiti]